MIRKWSPPETRGIKCEWRQMDWAIRTMWKCSTLCFIVRNKPIDLILLLLLIGGRWGNVQWWKHEWYFYWTWVFLLTWLKICLYIPISLYLLWVAAVELLTIVFILSFCSMTPSILWRICSKFTLRVAVNNNNITTLDHLNFPPSIPTPTHVYLGRRACLFRVLITRTSICTDLIQRR